MSRTVQKYNILDKAAPRAIASSTNASPIVITTGAPHGYVSGDKVSIVGHAVNTNANGSWQIVVTGPTTFQLVGSSGNGVGGATGTHAPKSKIAFCVDAENVVLAFDADNASTLTAKVVGSIQEEPPDFAKPQSADNQYDFLQIIDLDESIEVDGSTGVVLAAATVHKMYEVNTNAMRWISVQLIGTAGALTVKASVFNER
jgi:hypothetical protein